VTLLYLAMQRFSNDRRDRAHARERGVHEAAGLRFDSDAAYRMYKSWCGMVVL